MHSDGVAHIPWFHPHVGVAEMERIRAVLASNYINDGEVARELERKLAAQLGAAYCVAVTSGTIAIAVALMGLGVGYGDEVIVPDLTFIATANAVRLVGASVKLVDVEPVRFCIDVEKVEAAIGPRTKAIVSVDVNGRGANYVSLENICRKHGLFLVCDAAEALGSSYRGRPLGSFGHAGCFSFSANKTVSSGQGGLVATNDEALYHRLRELKDQGRRFGGTGGDDSHPVMGFNFKYTNVQAAIALAQIDRLDKRLAHFRRRDEWYRELLADCPTVTFPPQPNWDGEVLQWTDILCEDRAAVEQALKVEGIDCRAFWFPLHRQQPYKLPDIEFMTSINIAGKGLWLPSSFDLTEAQAERVADTIWRAVEHCKA